MANQQSVFPSTFDNTSSSSAAAAAASASRNPQQQDVDVFQARPSHRVGRRSNNNGIGLEQADGNTWQEYLAVCDIQNKLQIRSYFQNLCTGKRVWDEPPSGASHILPATEEMHRMATLQLNELYIAGGEAGNDSDNKKEKKKKSGLLGSLLMGRNGRMKNNESAPKRKIQYKPGSKLRATGQKDGSSAADPQLQAAIARSIADSHGLGYTEGNDDQNEDDDLAMAKALSLSDSITTNRAEDEEELLQRALEQSKLEMTNEKYATSNYAQDDRKPQAK